jgi:hypothetical protein
MNGITITSVATLLALCLTVYDPWGTGGQGEKDSAGGLNAAQAYNRLATDARDVKQSIRDVRRPTREVKQRVTVARSARRHRESARRSMTSMRQDMNQQSADFELRVVETRVDYGANGCVPSRCEDRELRVVETPVAEQVIIDVRRPTEGAKAVYVEVQEQSVEPVDVEYVRYSGAWAQARKVYLAAPERQECPTPYKVRVGLSVR